MYEIIWLAALVILLIAEALTCGLTTIWFAGGALIALAAALFGANVWIQLGVFLAVSLLLLIYGVWLFCKDVCRALFFRSVSH